MAVDALIVELDLPTALLVDALAFPGRDIVAHDLNLPGAGTEQGVEQGADDGLHAAAQDDDGDVVLAGPGVELLEARVELDILLEDVHALVEGRVDGVHHLLEGVAEVHAAVEDVLVSLDALLAAVAEVVGDVVIRVGGGDGAVEVSEEDVLGVGGQGRGVVADGAHGDGGGGNGCGNERVVWKLEQRYTVYSQRENQERISSEYGNVECMLDLKVGWRGRRSRWENTEDGGAPWRGRHVKSMEIRHTKTAIEVERWLFV